MRIWSVLVGLALALPFLGVLHAAETAEEARVRRARAVLDALVKEDFATAGKDFDETMRKVLPPDKLQATWKQLTEMFGPFKSVTAKRITTVGKYDLVIFSCAFAKESLECRVVFDADGKVSGLGFRKQPDFKPPPYARPDSYREETVVVGAGGSWPLPGTLTLPRGEGPFPGVVLLHGSGPQDRDETIGSNKPLRDLAWGLASQGIAVLRFEKRTREHGVRLVQPDKSDRVPDLTIKEEVIDDALAALTLLRSRKEIDAKKLFLIGHSLGAHLAPVVAARDGKLAGVVLLAANSRPLEDLVLDQIRYLLSLEGKPSPEAEKRLAELEKQVPRVKDSKVLEKAAPADLPLGLPAPYWKSLQAGDAVGTAGRLDLPILVLQGERDYQVSMADFAGWKKALEGKKNARLKSYPALNHLFMEGTGKSTPTEYDRPGHVSKEVVDDIAGWIKGR
jgi:dienelactone hydrolase